jgi:hypothetical protein
MARKTQKKARKVNATGHWVYLRTSPDDPYANSDHLRGFAPGDPVEADNDVLQAEVDKHAESGALRDEDEYAAEQELGYEIHPSDRPAVVADVPDAVAAGNNSLAPAGGLNDGPPPRGDAPGFGFEGAITTADAPVSGTGSQVAVTGTSDADARPAVAGDPATTEPEPEDPERLVSDDAKDKGVEVEPDAGKEKK